MSEQPEHTPDCETQNGKAKSEIVARVARIVRRSGLDYEGWRYVAKRVRKECSLQPAKKGRRLPKVLTGDDFRRFFEILDRSEDVQHSLMIRLLFFTGMRVSELCNTQVSDVDLGACRIRVEQGKGGKDRTVLFGKSFAVALRTHIASHPDNRWLFQTRRNTRYSTRRVQQIVSAYAKKAGVKATPHTFRHQVITWLTRHSGMADAELQLLTGHSKRETLSIYQHIALDGELEAKYQQAMKESGLQSVAVTGFTSTQPTIRTTWQAWLDVRPPVSSQRVFIGCRGALKEDGVRKLCDKYSAILGVRFHPHTLRHSMAHQYLLDNQNDLVGLGMLLGHESLNTTRRYSLKTAEALAEGAERIGW